MFFSCVGVPEEILTDQGTNFMSSLLSLILLTAKNKADPYHTRKPMVSFNGTLKSMLRKATSAEGQDWDQLLPYLLFAYQEVLQASSGFAPFKLLYGCNVRGTLTF